MTARHCYIMIMTVGISMTWAFSGDVDLIMSCSKQYARCWWGCGVEKRYDALRERFNSTYEIPHYVSQQHIY